MVQWNSTFLRLMAGPGTGKTYQMMQTVADLLNAQADPRRMLVVTFTRVAAASLVEELESLGVGGCTDIRKGTLHAFCFSLLSRAEVFDYLGRVARPLVTFKKRGGTLAFEAEPLLEDLNNRPLFGGKRDRTKRMREFEAAWARLQTDVPGWPHDAIDQEFQRALEGWLRFHNAILIGELVPESLRYLRNNPACPERAAFDYVVVDEYQDLNRADQALLDLLTGAGRGFVIGDEDQSIYSFRYAHPQGILEFPDTHADTQRESLEECRRCPKRVVAMADHLVRHNHPGVNVPRLRPRPQNPEGTVHIVQWESVQEEARGLAQYVHHLTSHNHFRPEDVLILCPRRLMGYGIRDELDRLRVPVHSFYHEEALEESEAQCAFAILTLLANNDDRVALRYWLGFGSPSWRSGEYVRLRRLCVATGLSPWEALSQIAAGTRALPGTGEVCARFAMLRDRLRVLQPLSLGETADALFPDGVAWAELLREASMSALEGGEAEGRNAQWLLDKLRTEITQPELPEEGDFVRIMSLHRSKGLTAKVVLVAGCIHGLIPFFDRSETPAEQEDTLREQRRLFYVACTRPRDTLILSSVVSMEKQLGYRIGATLRGRGLVGRTVTSQFIAELGPSAPQPINGRTWHRNGFQ